MGLAKVVRPVAVALLCVVALAGVSPGADAAVVTAASPTVCRVLSAADLGKPQVGTFTDVVQGVCLELPPLPVKSAIEVVRPASSSRTVSLNRTVSTADGTTVCTDNNLTERGCVLKSGGPFRLWLAPRSAHATGTYAVVVQPLSGDTGCAADLQLSRVGAADTLDVTLSADTFTRCFSLPAGRHSTRELVTMSRTAGDSGARFGLFDESGNRACLTNSSAEVTPTYVLTCNLVSSNSYGCRSSEGAYLVGMMLSR